MQETSWCSTQVGAVGQFVQYVSEMSSRLLVQCVSRLNSRSVGAIGELVQ